MADFVLRLGPYGEAVKAAVPLWRRQPPKAAADAPLYVYEGPHGPLEVFRPNGSDMATEVRGESLEPVSFAWGPDTWRNAGARLKQGIECRVDGTVVTFSRPHNGLRRQARVMVVRAGGRTYTWRERGLLPKHHLEGPDGHALVRLDHTRHRGWMADGIGRVEVVIVVLFVTSELITRTPGLFS